MSLTSRIFNVKPSLRDKRDFVYTSAFKLDASVDLRAFDSPVEDQGALGSCATHAITSAYENQLKSKYPNRYKELSRLFLYYHARLLENTISEDAGVVYLRSALIAGNKFGISSEQFWQYDITQYDKQPSPISYADSCQTKIVNYKATPNITDMTDALTNGKPVVIGFRIYSSFMDVNAQNPIIPIPSVTETSLGGHAVCIVGYSAEDKHFIIKNSFGTDWGVDGYGYMPVEYVKLYAFDNWTFDISNPH